ncbi:MAG: hypothetical protein H0X39_02370 [Actinobacteria bacterium]|nr:hypothetical protein [Actinomycetota bacterium]
MSAFGFKLKAGLAVAGVVVVGLAAFELGKARAPSAQATVLRTIPAHLTDSFDLSAQFGSPAAIRTRVLKVLLGRGSWRVYARITNESAHPIFVSQPPGSFAGAYPHQGMSLILSPARPNSHGVAGQGRGSNEFQVLSARSFAPALGETIGAHETWSGYFAGTGTVPSGRKIFVGFGRFNVGSSVLSFSTQNAVTLRSTAKPPG